MSSQHQPGGGNLGYHLRRAQAAFRAEMDAALRPLGITTPQYSVLARLAEEPGASNAELARTALVTAQSMQGIVANLEKLNLVKRKPDPHHGRILQAQLTAAGQAALKKGHAMAAVVEDKMIGTMKPEDARRAAELLDRFAANLSAR